MVAPSVKELAFTLDDPCFGQAVGRRRVFWTTREQACGSYQTCGEECSIPGLQYINDSSKVADGRTIDNDGWLQSLILNILNTRARTDIRCPNPIGVFGHWSESYRDDGLYIGTTMWNAAGKSYTRVSDAVKAIGSAVRADLSKLIQMGVATSVDVVATYRGSNKVEIIATVVDHQGAHVLNLSGTYTSDSWVWH